MSFFEFPHTRTYDSDLGWLIKAVRKLQQAGVEAGGIVQLDRVSEITEDLSAGTICIMNGFYEKYDCPPFILTISETEGIGWKIADGKYAVVADPDIDAYTLGFLPSNPNPDIINANAGKIRSISFLSGDYTITKSIQIPDAGLILHGNGAVFGGNVIPFTRIPSATGEKQHYVNRIEIEGFTFDAGAIRGAYPHRNTTLGGYLRAFSLAADPFKESSATVRNCDFRNIRGLPFTLTGYRQVRLENITTYKTLDIGIVNCEKVIATGVVTKFSADNGLSISRMCKNVTVDGCQFHQSEGSGLWLAGYEIDQSSGATLTASGRFDQQFSVITVTSDTANALPYDYAGYVLRMTDGNGNVINLKMIECEGNRAEGYLYEAVPAFDGSNIASWAMSPNNGVMSCTVSDTIIDGFVQYGINATETVHDIQIDNVMIRHSAADDSEIHTRGYILEGSNRLRCDSAIFAIGDLVHLQDTSNSLDFYATVTAIQDQAIYTLSAVAPSDYIAAPCYLAHKNSAFGRALVANVASDPNGVPTSIRIYDTSISDTDHGIYLSRTGYGCAGSVILDGCEIDVPDSIGADASAAGLSPMTLLIVSDCRFDSMAVALQQTDAPDVYLYGCVYGSYEVTNNGSAVTVNTAANFIRP